MARTVADANLTTRSADLVLPAAGWGEMPGNRWNGERRLRLSDRFMDPPGEAKPDWWVCPPCRAALFGPNAARTR